MAQLDPGRRRRRRFLRPRPQWVLEEEQTDEYEEERLSAERLAISMKYLGKSMDVEADLFDQHLQQQQQQQLENEKPLLVSSQPYTFIEPYTDEGPKIAYNCLLIPVILVVWWYWTKRAAHGVAKGFLPGHFHPTSEYFGSVDNTTGCCDSDRIDEASSYTTLEIGGNMSKPTTETNSGGGTPCHHPPHDDALDSDPHPAILSEQDGFETWDDILQNSLQDDSHDYVKWIGGNAWKQKENEPNGVALSGKVKMTNKKTTQPRRLGNGIFTRRAQALYMGQTQRGGKQPQPLEQTQHSQKAQTQHPQKTEQFVDTTIMDQPESPDGIVLTTLPLVSVTGSTKDAGRFASFNSSDNSNNSIVNVNEGQHRWPWLGRIITFTYDHDQSATSSAPTAFQFIDDKAATTMHVTSPANGHSSNRKQQRSPL